MEFDLHTHTTASDGTLSPTDLLGHAKAAGVKVLSITDHDTTAAYAGLSAESSDHLRLIPGIELSTHWRSSGVHVLGLNVERGSDALSAATEYQQAARWRRAEVIAERLHKAGIPDALEGASTYATGSSIGRPHFARHLVSAGVTKDLQQAFNKYLGRGKIGDVKLYFASLNQIIEWIKGAHGTPVLAHPDKYGLTRTKRLALIDDFRALGGEGLEIISGRQDPSLTRSLVDTALAKNLAVSCGSDFHQLGQPWASLKLQFKMPAQCRPVWENW